MLGLFASGKLETSKVLGGVYELDNWHQAFDDMASGRVIKSVMVMLR